MEDNFSEEGMEEQPKSIIKDPLHRDVEEGQLYKNTITSVMKHYPIRERFQFKVKRSSLSRYYLKCINQRCNWTFKSSSQQNSEIFMVTKFVDDDTCPIADIMISQRHATSLTIAEMVKHNFLNLKSAYTPAEIMEEMRNFLPIHGKHNKSWIIHKATQNGGQSLLYDFVVLSTLIRGWRYFMPTIIVDGTFLKSAYKGTMLSASVLDAAGHILPLAYSVVDFENDASWEWFFCMFNTAFGEREGICIVSDSHDNILKTATLVYPNVAHCICIYHLWNNIESKSVKGNLLYNG
ncbi:uncharacterized protein LOC107844502 [Capsicum annuum]|uniref:uncharacterized protein LOC107844502 n=1 Tax=Capsicum annuum TaxID=4072 RepID=UPI001FB0BF38|nr:uncharacterized protein LOC107844502 [Capsicum annuum]